MRRVLALSAALFSPLSLQAVTIETVLIGNPGNVADVQPQGLFGSVTSTYRIGVTEVTNAQYSEFLNAVADTDPYELYHTSMGGTSQGGITRNGSSGSFTYAVKPDVLVEDPGGDYTYTYADKPVAYVSWYDAVRFANWLHNGQGSGATETGAYTISGGMPTPTNADSITRASGAIWFLPTEDEWYKAAYFDGDSSVYYDYPTGSDAIPDNNLPSADTGNSANFFDGDTTTGNFDYPHTGAGAYTLSESPYDTFDQGGNVWEWNEALVSAGMRGRRGGAWDSDATTLDASNRDNLAASFHRHSVGFRVASIPDADDLPGDYNDDGFVNAADYVLWRKNDGTQPGYNEWRDNFGMPSSAAGDSAIFPVPEPAAGVVLFSALTALLYRRPQRQAPSSPRRLPTISSRAR